MAARRSHRAPPLPAAVTQPVAIQPTLMAGAPLLPPLPATGAIDASQVGVVP